MPSLGAMGAVEGAGPLRCAPPDPRALLLPRPPLPLPLGLGGAAASPPPAASLELGSPASPAMKPCPLELSAKLQLCWQLQLYCAVAFSLYIEKKKKEKVYTDRRV